MYKKILVPLDRSHSDQTILTHVRALARLTGGELILVHVADGYAARLKEQLDLADSQEIMEDGAYLKERVRELKAEGFPVKSHLLAGEPTEEILKIADQEKCDLIAMSTHGHRLVKDVLLGSVADSLRHRTTIPILMIRAAK